jgi:hypothetical protein
MANEFQIESCSKGYWRIYAGDKEDPSNQVAYVRELAPTCFTWAVRKTGGRARNFDGALKEIGAALEA